MYHQKKRIKGGGSMKMFDHHHMMSENPEVDYFFKYFIPMPLPFLLITINRKEGTHTHSD